MLENSVDVNAALNVKADGVTAEAKADASEVVAKETARTEVIEGDGIQFCERDNAPNEFNPDGLTLRGQLEEAFDTAIPKERRYVYIGRFTQPFVDALKKHIEIKNSPIVMNYRDAYLSMESKENGKYQGEGINYHNLGISGLEAALKSFDRPEYVLMSTKEGKIELILEGKDYKNRQLFSIVEVNTKAQNKVKVLDAHVVTSVYGNKNLSKRIALAEQEGRLIYDKNKDEEISQGTPQVQYKRGINDNSSSKDSILNSHEKNNKQIVNNDGVQFSEKDYPIDTKIQNQVKDAITKSTNEMHTISEITQAQNNAINRLVNTAKNDFFRGKYTGGKHLVSNAAIRHTISEHGDFLREALRAQLPMTPNDIARHLSAVKNNKNPSNIIPSNTKRGTPSIITAYEVNGYTLYAEEIKKSLGQNTPSDLIGHTMYKAPTLATAAALATSTRTLPKRQSMVLRDYYTTDATDLSSGNFITDINGNPAKLYFAKQNNTPKSDQLSGALIALSSDSANFTDKSKSFGQGYVVCKKPFYITAVNRVFSNSETNVAEKINELKKQGYDCFIFDKVIGDNYMVAVVNKAQIISDEATIVNDENVQLSEKDYSYESLIKKSDMTLTVVGDDVPSNRADIIHLAKKNIAEIGTTDTVSGGLSVYVDDIDTNVIIGTDGLKHGLRRTVPGKADANYIVTVKAGEIIKNSIKINDLTPSKESAESSYVLIGAAKTLKGDLYIVRSVINKFSNQLTSMDVLYAINAKKESAVLNAPRFADKPLSVTDSAISIADLLEYVNRYFPDILPESVLRHYGHTERPGGTLGESVLFSEKDNGISAYDIMGEYNALEKRYRWLDSVVLNNC